ncbi:hypothetical protein NEPAR06_2033 [Nematocida parisii]|nr:hypothetical protein NEPAR08_1654 [Nematocida parisii]KAI5166424.1 hypothetical protein NEIRO02_1107 [Nematocida sp. AWRm79]KAI5183226.1 hypothetical protein NEIRO03_0841 [Nematocida sp. AWRm78]OAG32791.1 hypothetical protein NEIG_02108 [Nematocida sp. ERTm5]KAI5129612.1 hypothetical protein NEPAR03_1742 [Nematocida parisii]
MRVCELFSELEGSMRDTALDKYNIHYYTVDDLLKDPVIGRGVQALYKKNYM